MRFLLNLNMLLPKHTTDYSLLVVAFFRQPIPSGNPCVNIANEYLIYLYFCTQNSQSHPRQAAELG